MSLLKKLAAATILVASAIAITRKRGANAKAESDDTGATKALPTKRRSPAQRIVLGQDYEVTFWMRRLGVSKGELESAVRRVGPSVSKVRRHLTRAR